MIPTVVAFIGPKRCGKDTAALFLNNEYGYHTYKFAAPLKAAVCALFGFTTQQVEGPEKDIVDSRWNVTPRSVLQVFGTEISQYAVAKYFPSIGRELFAKRLVQDMCDFPAVVTDMRFLHEYNVLKRHFPNLIVVRIYREDCVEDSHVSEQEYKQIPTTLHLHNDEDIDSFYEKIRSALCEPLKTL